MNYFRCTVGGSGKGNTVTVTCAEEFAGLTITLAKTGKTYTKTCPSTAPYVVTFYGVENGTYTVSGTVDGQTFSETVVVQDISCVLNYGFNWKLWVDTASQLDSTDYASLSEVLADEEALRELFLEHACVDYMAESTTSNADLETIINDDYCAKWINLSDYALDFLHANEVIADLMDEADKYFYGEWALMPQVPTMTSNTAPFGTASASSEYSATQAAWKAFDNDTSTRWLTADNVGANAWLKYDFGTEVKISRVRLHPRYNTDSSNLLLKGYKIQGSNDNFSSDIHDLYTDELSNTNVGAFDIDLQTSDDYRYYRIFATTDSYLSSKNIGITELQFYAWAPKGNVPVMTANNAPYGTAYVSNEYQSNYAYLSFVGMDKLRGSAVSSNGSIGNYLYYKFTNPVNVRKIRLYNPNTSSEGQYVPSVILKYSDDGTNWHDTTTTYQYDFTELKIVYLNVSDYGYHLYWAIFSTAVATGGYARFANAQFYGRELKVSVPKMTSNTAPFGEVSANSYISGCETYKAFDNDSTTFWIPIGGSTNNYIGYTFVSPIMLSKLVVSIRETVVSGYTQQAREFKIQGSNDGFVSDINDLGIITVDSHTATTTEEKSVNINNLTAYSSIRLFCADVIHIANQWSVGMLSLQFYGLDYSEKEFEAGTTKKWLYDHGVEVMPITYANTGTNTVAKNTGNEIYLHGGSGTVQASGAMAYIGKIDLTPYSLMRMIYGKIQNSTISGNYRIYADPVISSLNVPSYNWNTSVVALKDVTDTSKEMPNNVFLNISSVTGQNNPAIIAFRANDWYNRESEIEEWWLE